MNIFSSTRTFVIYSYAASHGLLLLRSKKTEATPSRVDILFQDVRAIEIRCWFDGIAIEKQDKLEVLASHPSKPLQMVEPGIQVYRLVGRDWEGMIVGGIVQTHEDQGEFSEESYLLRGA